MLAQSLSVKTHGGVFTDSGRRDRGRHLATAALAVAVAAVLAAAALAVAVAVRCPPAVLGDGCVQRGGWSGRAGRRGRGRGQHRGGRGRRGAGQRGWRGGRCRRRCGQLRSPLSAWRACEATPAMHVISTAWREGQVNWSNLVYTFASQAHLTYHFLNRLILFAHIFKCLLRLR